MTTATPDLEPATATFATRPTPVVPMPLPEAWVQAGAPAPRGTVAIRAGHVAAGTWEVGPGRFDYTHARAETIVVLAGAVDVTTPDGRTTRLTPGDFAHFPQGLTTTWDVQTHVRKAFFLT